MLQLSEREWADFLLTDYFEIAKGNQNNMAELQAGAMPLISAKKIDNGCKGFFAANSKPIFKGHCLTINNDGDGGAGISYYQPTDMLLDTHVTALYPSVPMTAEIMRFIAACITVQREKFGHGYSLNNARLSVFRMMLPADDDGKPDYAFMEQYIREREKQLIAQYIEHIGAVTYTGGGITPLHEKEWKEFCISDIFVIRPGKRLTKSDMQSGNKPFIGASDSNNGITAFVNNTNVSEDSNVLGVNYNGSVVENFYHPYTCIFSDDVKRFTIKDGRGNEFVYLFLKSVILQQKSKYAYGYKFNEERMRRQILLLPVGSNGQPDWQYMEQYAKMLMAKLKLQYLQSKQAQ